MDQPSIRGHRVEIEGIGEAWVETWDQNKLFHVWYGPIRFQSSRSVYHMETIVNVAYEYGKWIAYECAPRTEYPQELADRLGAAILTVKPLRVKLEQWRKDSVRRLRKSVPRLKKEYEASVDRLAALSLVSFA